MTEHHPKYQIIAGISGTFTLLGLSTLIFNVHNTKKTDNLTYSWFFFILSAQILLLLFLRFKFIMTIICKTISY